LSAFLSHIPCTVAVGMPVARHPPHSSRRAALPHRAPASGLTCRPPQGPAIRGRARVTGVTRPWVRSLVCTAAFPWARALPATSSAGPWRPPWVESFLGTMKRSDALHPCLTVVPRTGSPCAPGDGSPGQMHGLPGSAHRVSAHARGLRPCRVRLCLAVAASTVWPSACSERVGTQE
jgi:hypothetical protein